MFAIGDRVKVVRNRGDSAKVFGMIGVITRESREENLRVKAQFTLPDGVKFYWNINEYCLELVSPPSPEEKFWMKVKGAEHYGL